MSASENRAIAVASYNRAQDLYYSTRTPEQDHEMLQEALTSRHHWRLVGGEQQFAVSDWFMSRIYVQFNEPRLAVEFALAAISHKQDGFPAWQRASLLATSGAGKVKFKPVPYFTNGDCVHTTCVFFITNDHNAAGDKSQDQTIPFTFSNK